MKQYNFDKIIERRGTASLKYDFALRRGRPADVLPFWVADMDLPVADEITEALTARARHGIFGYTETAEEYFNAVSGWYAKNFGWQTKEEELTKTPGVVFALAMCVQAYTAPGESVLINQPVYYPFSEVIEDNGRRIVSVPLRSDGGRYRLDFEAIETAIVKNKVKLYLLCSPHNPVGRVWTKDELQTLGDICLRYGVVLVSDEIHSDFVWSGSKHTVFAALGEAYAQSSVICTAPSKTFNIAGLQVSNIFIKNKELRRRFRRAVNAAGYSQMNTMGLTACQAAYTSGANWLVQVRRYIYDNLLFTKKYLEEQLPQISTCIPEGTYLMWLDCRGLGMPAKEREQWLWHEAKLWLDSGGIFGPEGENFERINVACPRAVLLQGLEQLKRAAQKLPRK